MCHVECHAHSFRKSVQKEGSGPFAETKMRNNVYYFSLYRVEIHCKRNVMKRKTQLRIYETGAHLPNFLTPTQ